jgi:hypothetical protein
MRAGGARRRMMTDPSFVWLSSRSRTPQNSVYSVFHKDFKDRGRHAWVGRRFVRCVGPGRAARRGAARRGAVADGRAGRRRFDGVPARYALRRDGWRRFEALVLAASACSGRSEGGGAPR